MIYWDSTRASSIILEMLSDLLDLLEGGLGIMGVLLAKIT